MKITESWKTGSGNIKKNTQTLKDTINKWDKQQDVGVVVLDEVVILINRKSKIAAIAEMNGEFANGFDINRVMDYWTTIFANIGFQLGRLESDQFSESIGKNKKRKFRIGDKVIKINTCRLPRKKKRVGKYLGWKPQYKKAIVTLSEGDVINLFTEN